MSRHLFPIIPVHQSLQPGGFQTRPYRFTGTFFFPSAFEQAKDFSPLHSLCLTRKTDHEFQPPVSLLALSLTHFTHYLFPIIPNNALFPDQLAGETFQFQFEYLGIIPS